MVFLAKKTFSDETFSSLKVFFLNQIRLLVIGFLEEMSFVTKSPILSLKVLSDKKLDF